MNDECRLQVNVRTQPKAKPNHRRMWYLPPENSFAQNLIIYMVTEFRAEAQFRIVIMAYMMGTKATHYNYRGSWQMNMAHNWWKSALNYWKCATMLTGNDWWTKQYALWVGWGWEWDLFVRFVGIMSHTHSGGYLELTLQMAIQNAGNDRFIDFVESNQSKQSPVVFYSHWLESHQ